MGPLFTVDSEGTQVPVPDSRHTRVVAKYFEVKRQELLWETTFTPVHEESVDGINFSSSNPKQPEQEELKRQEWLKIGCDNYQ